MLTIGPGRNITNSGNDYKISDGGYEVAATNTPDKKRSFSVVDGGSQVGAFRGNSVNIFLEAFGSATMNVKAPGFLNVYTGSGNTSVSLDGPAGEIKLNAETRVQVEGSVPFKAPVMTQTARDNISPEAGDIVYNTTIDQFQGYDGSNWRDITQA